MTATGRWRAHLDGARWSTTSRRRGHTDDPAAPDAAGLPRLHDVDLADLGVHPPLPSPAFERDADHRIEAAVGGDAAVVIVVGPRLGGSTHALARAARLLLGDHRVVRPDPAALAGSAPLTGPADPALVAALADPADGADGAGVVVWLDAVGPALLAALHRARPPEGVRVLATADAALLDPDITPGEAGPGVTLVRLPDGLSPTEVTRARPTVATAALGARVGDLLVDRAPARAMLVPGADEPGRMWRPARLGDARTGASARAAVLRAAVDWERLGVPHALPTPLLARLALAYARDGVGSEDDPDALPGVDDLGRAVEALVAERSRRSGAPVLRRLRLADGVHHVPAGLLTAAADDLGVDGWTPPARFGEIVGDVLDAPEARGRRRSVGRLALARGFDDLAAVLLRPPPDRAAPRSTASAELYRLGIASLQAGRAAEARRWFAAVLEGTPDDGSARAFRARAAFWLGLDRDADPAQRRQHLELVVRDGPPRDASDAALLLAGLERDAGRFDAQRGCLRAAVSSARRAGDSTREAEASLDLAHLDRNSGRTDEARTGYTRVLELVDADTPTATAASRAVVELDADENDGDAGTPDERDPDREIPGGFVPEAVPEQRQDEAEPSRPDGPRASL
ncbi:tetratricopeptide repeat protein [Actinomycetospora sp.]|jgi:tetratricopeptide (TPR) repeat protein|uniref:tetratricopeptide repeat protein n=1 Tax=Actinomycetospora sp. TaxID=1872135 RepID=UPI002F40CF90